MFQGVNIGHCHKKCYKLLAYLLPSVVLVDTSMIIFEHSVSFISNNIRINASLWINLQLDYL